MTPRSERVPVWDWLRLGAVWLLLPYHAARVYDDVAYYVEADVGSSTLALAARLVEQWHMPLLFLVAGAVAVTSLRRRSAMAFAAERVARLLVPFAFGLVTLAPVTGWLAARHHVGRTEGFLAYWPSFFTVDLDRLDGFTGTFSPQHLWFLLYLLVFAVVTLPLTARLARGRWRGPAEQAAAAGTRRPALLMVVVAPVLAAQLVALPYPSPVVLVTWYLVGAVLGSDRRLVEAVVAGRWWALVLAATLAAGYVGWRLVGAPDDHTDPLLGWQLLRAAHTTAWLVALVGFAATLPAPTGRAWRWLLASALPVYLLHHPLMVVLAPAALELTQPLASYGALTAAAVVVTAAAAAAVVRSGPARPLFGVRR